MRIVLKLASCGLLAFMGGSSYAATDEPPTASLAISDATYTDLIAILKQVNTWPGACGVGENCEVDIECPVVADETVKGSMAVIIRQPRLSFSNTLNAAAFAIDISRPSSLIVHVSTTPDIPGPSALTPELLGLFSREVAVVRDCVYTAKPEFENPPPRDAI